MAEEIINLKAEIFDIIRQQEGYIAMANNLQQKRLEKIQELREAQKGTIEDIIKLKSQAYDIVTQQESYIEAANNLQQIKLQKLQLLNDMEQKVQQKCEQQVQMSIEELK